MGPGHGDRGAAKGEDSARIAPLSDERDAMTTGLRASNREQVAAGAGALWVLHCDLPGKSFYRAKVEPTPKSTSDGPTPLYKVTERQTSTAGSTSF